MKYSNRLLFHLCFATVLQLISTNATSQKAVFHWQKVANGIWKVEIGKPEKTNLLTIAGVAPKTQAINEMTATSFPIAENEIKAEVYDGKTYLRLPLDKNEKIFGLGLNFKTK